MTDKTEWLRRYASFQGQVQQLVAEDITEHGKPHADREETFRDLKQRCIEMGGLAFEAYVTVCRLEETVALAKAIAEEASVEYGGDVAWADRNPDGKTEP